MNFDIRVEKVNLKEEKRRLCLNRVKPARTSGIVNLVFSRQTGFSSAHICLLINRWP